MNGLLMFISVLGGVSLFGLLGIVPGTLVSATVTDCSRLHVARRTDHRKCDAERGPKRTARDTVNVGSDHLSTNTTSATPLHIEPCGLPAASAPSGINPTAPGSR